MQSNVAFNKVSCCRHAARLRTDSKAAGNTGFASGGLTCKLGALCSYSSSVLVDSFVLRNPPERKARKRKPFFKTLKLSKHENSITWSAATILNTLF